MVETIRCLIVMIMLSSLIVMLMLSSPYLNSIRALIKVGNEYRRICCLQCLSCIFASKFNTLLQNILLDRYNPRKDGRCIHVASPSLVLAGWLWLAPRRALLLFATCVTPVHGGRTAMASQRKTQGKALPQKGKNAYVVSAGGHGSIRK